MKKILTTKEIAVLRSLTKKDNTLTARAKQAINELKIYKNIRVYEKTGSGKNTRQQQRKVFKDIELIIKLFNIKYEVLNDAPRGGKLGLYIKIKDKNIKDIDVTINKILKLEQNEN